MHRCSILAEAHRSGLVRRVWAPKVSHKEPRAQGSPRTQSTNEDIMFACGIIQCNMTPTASTASRRHRKGAPLMKFLGYRELGVWDGPGNDGDHRIAKFYQGM